MRVKKVYVSSPYKFSVKSVKRIGSERLIFFFERFFHFEFELKRFLLIVIKVLRVLSLVKNI